MSSLIAIIVIALLLFWRIFRIKVKGAIGEKTISAVLYFLDKSKYKVINNVVLEANGKTTQIDHVVIPHAVGVITVPQTLMVVFQASYIEP
ncbi:MAG: hypothetical protein K0S09_847 [Sphingobacteriaceae bacterium]|jgi:hypothetical protein|nr:hypothetical protein [Sphingobacteriaceae bacterium]